MNRSTPGVVHHQLLESLRLKSIESVMPSSHLILCGPLLLLPPIPPSIKVSSNESTLRMRWPKYGSFSFSIIPSKEIPRLYDLNQIPYDYTVEVRNRFKGLDLIECLMNYGMSFLTWYRKQGSRPLSWKRTAKKQNSCEKKSGEKQRRKGKI